jgi:phosphoglycerate dehydrogenase-like enzyme
MRPKVFVVQPIPQAPLEVFQEVADVEVFENLRRQISLEETIEAARRSDYLVALHGNYMPAEVINANPDLKGIAILGGTTAKVDFDAALARKVPVVSSLQTDMHTWPGGGVSVATADLTIAMLLCLAYRLFDADRYTRASSTFQEQTMALMGLGCPLQTVGLIGLGKVGRYMVPRLRPFNVNILYLKRTRLSSEEERALGLEWTDLDDLLRRSDYVCMEVDYNESTHEMLGAREFALMKPTAYLVNTARGRILDERALIKALQDGTIAGAALDVYYGEPPQVWDPEVPAELREMQNVILAPHNGGATFLSRGRQIMPLAQGIKALIKGERPQDLLNPEIYGEEKRYPQLYGRGPIIPAVDGGPANFPIL